MKHLKLIAQAALFFCFMTIITGVFYPFLITCFSRVLWPEKSLGSLIKNPENLIIGSELLAQNFSGSEYFWPRPSASNFNACPSQASNLGPTSKKLKELISSRREILSETHNTNFIKVPESLVTSSGSGLDPHISKSALNFQTERVIKARALDKGQEKELGELIAKNLEQPRLRASKEPYINVLLLNLALDQSFGKIQP